MPNAEGSFEDVREKIDGNPMRLLFGYVATYWRRLSAGVLFSVIMRVVLLVPDFAIATAIDRIIVGSGEPGIMARVGLMPKARVSGVESRLDLLYRLAVVVAVAWVVLAVTRWASRYLFQSTAQMVQHDLRNDTYEHMQRLSMDFYNDHQTGGMMAILNADINRLENFFNTEIRQIVRAVVMVSVMTVVMFVLAPRLALLVLAPMPIIVLSTAKVMMWLEPKYQRIRETVARLNTRLSNNLGGLQVLKAFDRYDIEEERITDQSERYRDENIEAIKIRKAFFASLRLLIGAAFVAVLVVGGRDAVISPEEGITVGTFTLFFLFLRRFRSPMQRLGKIANKYQKAKSSTERVFGILGYEPTVTSPKNGHVPDGVTGDVAFEDVTFSYQRDGERVLNDVSLDVEPGETVGFAGPSGSGKSTLLKLLPRFHDVNSGAIRVDGVNVCEYDIQALRDEIGIVEQTPYMFSGTVFENIAYGDREIFEAVYAGDVTERMERRIREVARSAGAHEFVEELPDGYETEVGERGVKLSGGQRQRISIARALLNDPAIVILDEATSDVDTETEELIQANLDRLIDDRTAFVIAHRLSTIRDADRIVVMDEGEITETGTHTELLDCHGTYAELWQRQTDLASATRTDTD
jgi:ATP-binding cassette subfamily B protein